MDFSSKLAKAAALTNARLDTWLSADTKRRRASGAAALNGPTPKRLAEAMRYAVLNGGKRLRPFLVLEGAQLFDVDPETAVDVAAALECVHSYSLVHDDLPVMDNDSMRRGIPTVWKKFDEWTAILAGDALLTLAFEILAHPTQRIAPRTQIELIHTLARCAGRGGMVGGQQLDLDAERQTENKKRPDADQIIALQAMKTGALIRFACMSGSMMADRPPADEEAMAAFGAHLGLAFQISDDLLDAVGDAAVVGKAVAKDEKANKATLVSLQGLASAQTHLRKTVDAALQALAPYSRKADGLRDAARYMLTRQS
jgi:farnesyl diphosphate synthase